MRDVSALRQQLSHSIDDSLELISAFAEHVAQNETLVGIEGSLGLRL